MRPKGVAEELCTCKCAEQSVAEQAREACGALGSLTVRLQALVLRMQSVCRSAGRRTPGSGLGYMWC